MKTRWFNWQYIVGVALIFVGGLTLMQTMGLLPYEGSLAGYIIGILFLIGGLSFFLVMMGDSQKNWWAVIPGMVLLGISSLIVGGQIMPAFFNRFGGTVFMGSLALAFWLVFLISRRNWWAIIPGGVLSTLAVITGLDKLVSWETGGVLFLGLAATFMLVAILPGSEDRMSWPWIPAGILLVIGILIMSSATGAMNYLWPAAMIGAGIYILFRTILRR
jgi:hypothetical protein